MNMNEGPLLLIAYASRRLGTRDWVFANSAHQGTAASWVKGVMELSEAEIAQGRDGEEYVVLNVMQISAQDFRWFKDNVA